MSDRTKARAREARYRAANPNWRENNRQAQARWRAKNKAKVRAVQALNKAIARGEIARPSTCSKCGLCGGPIQAHHPNYLAPFAVVWLCVPCHERLHHK